ncbi:DUF7282 domain-containing protein [Haloarcula rubra]|uniref:DUF7282 domain-containing protein n=1 Tax=Haloarcula rubra TaxID=2487747 RepID=UPI003CCBEA19
MALTVLTSGIAGVAAAETDTDSELAQTANGASVTFANQTSGGDTVTVDSVTLPDGGYVTVHDASLNDGAVLGSVAGTSTYLGPGTHENVTVTLTDDVSDGSYVAMAHEETDGDRTYEFVASNGQTDGPYTTDGDIVLDGADVTVSASVSMSDQPTTGDSVVVDRVVLSEGGFVTVHDASVTEGAVFESIRGTSTYLGPGVHEDVRVLLDEPLTENATLVPMAHVDTNGDEAYTFEESEGEADGPYATADGSAVVDTAAATVTDTARTTLDAQATGGHAVVVESVFVPDGGFVTIHDGTVAEGAVFDSVRGTSTHLEPGYHTDVVVTLDTPVENDTTLVAMPHRDTDDDETYDFVETSGEDDGPYTEMGSAVTDSGAVTVSAAVTIADQSSDGTTVVVDRVDVSEGGFVAVHDATLLDGAVFDSVVGHSEYLEPGVHENVTVTLDDRLASGQTLVAMPHVDSDGDEAYTFVESEGDADGPYTAGGDAVVDTAQTTIEASLAFESQTTDGETVTVDAVTLQDGGFVTVHDASVTEGAVFESIRGTSAYLAPGTHENVTVTLSDPVTENTTLVPMAHRDTDGDEAYTFAESEGSADGPYVAAGSAVVAVGDLSVESATMDDESATEDAMTEEPTATEMEETSTTGGSGPGFTAAVALVALVATALLARRQA